MIDIQSSFDAKSSPHQMRRLFRDPPHDFRPSAYWFWHSIPDEQTSRRQLADFKAKGIGTILIQTRTAFARDLYLGRPYLAAYRKAIEIAGDLGLKAGIYDDYNWISGQAGGRTVLGRDDLRERHLFWATNDGARGSISGIRATLVESMGADILNWQYDDGKVHWRDWTVEAALLHPQGAIDDVGQIVDVTSNIRFDDFDALSCRYTFSGNVPDGFLLTVFISARSATSRLINYLLPEATERFIEVGLTPYVEALDDLIPDPLGFVFYDQPAAGFYRWDQHHGNLGNSILFADELPAVFALETGEEFSHALLSLLGNVGKATKSIRAAFYACYSKRMNEAFFATLRDWADRSRIAFTGHELLPHVGAWSLNGGFTSIDPRVAPATDFFGIDRFRRTTAVDANNFSAQLAPKMGDSVARANGRSRCIVETYATSIRSPMRAAGQWELTLESARAQAIRLHCLGARQFLWHGVYQTDGHDGDATPFSNPRFDFAPGINFEPWWTYHDLFAAETSRISAFIEPAKPRASIAVLYPLYTAWAEGPLHGHAVHVGAWCEELTGLGLDYMLISEADLAAADVGGGRLVAAGLSFAVVVLPSVTVLQSPDCLETLRRFRADGGAIWCSGDPLEATCYGSLDEPADVATCQFPGVPSGSQVVALTAGLPMTGPGIIPESDGKPWQWVGLDPEGWWRVVLFNDGPKPLKCGISLGSAFDCEIWDATNGDIESQTALSSFVLSLEPHAAYCLRFKEGDAPGSRALAYPSLPVVDLQRAISLVGGWTLTCGATAVVPISVDRGWEEQGYSAFSGTASYRRSLCVETEESWLLELPGVETAATVRLNGREIGRRAWRPYRFILGKLAPGNHALEISVSNTAAGRYYADTPYQGESSDPGGLTATPRLIPLIHNH